MAEAIRTLSYPLVASNPRLRAAVVTLARRRAMKIAEQQLRRQGLKPQCTSRRIIVEMADEVRPSIAGS